MNKELKISNYLDGIDESKIICTEVPIAVACGFYDTENYFYYLLSQCVRMNWYTSSNSNYDYVDIFSNLGLELITLNIQTPDDIITTIKSNINNNIPVLLPIEYGEIFFFAEYKKKWESHYFLVTGYNSENNIVYLKLSPHMFSETILNNNIGLYTFRIREDLLKEIWENSNKRFIERKSVNQNIAFGVKKIKESKVQNIADLLKEILLKYNFNRGKFIDKINNFDEMLDKEFRKHMYYLRIFFEKYMEVFFYILEKYLVEEEINKKILDKFLALKEEYLKARKLYISKYQICYTKKQNLDLKNIVVHTQNLDKSLNSLLKEIYDLLKVKNTSQEVNFVHNCTITASSEDEEYFSAQNVKDDSLHIWRTANTEGPHWLQFSFPNKIRIKRVLITHDSNSNKLTRDYIIQGANDPNNWEDIVSIKDNILFKTIHRIKNKTYKYMRIYITIPAILSKQARISKVEIYGTEE